MIAVVDIGLGNIQAFLDIYKRLNVAIRVAKNPADLYDADKFILPGVGAFDWAMERLDASGMREALDRLVKVEHRPVLGVCVGMQIMAEGSAEGSLKGLGWIPGRVERFPVGSLPVPHMGWNDVEPADSGSLFRDIPGPRYYFLHSYYFVSDSKLNILATTDYGIKFTSAVACANVFGTQFHPEKSHDWGVKLLQNFADL